MTTNIREDKMMKITGGNPRMALIGLSTLAALLFGLASIFAVSNSKAEAQAAGAASYTVTDLGALPGGTDSEASGINDAGQVVGRSSDAENAAMAFLYENGAMNALDAFTGGDYGEAFDINESGQAVGASSYPQGEFGNGPTHAILWNNNGQITDLGALLDSPEDKSRAYAINDSGRVVGESQVIDENGSFWDHAFLWQNSNMTDLGTLDPSGIGDSVAYDINESGQIVGEADLEGFTGTHAFLSQDGEMTDLGTLDGSHYSVAYAINGSGQVVGESAGYGFIWENGGMMSKLTDARSEEGGILPASINDAGQVVGVTGLDGGGEGITYHAAIWQNGEVKDLNDLVDPASGWKLDKAADINDEGQIAGTGTIGGESHAFLLTPVPDTTPPADNTAPVLEVPADITVNATSPNGAKVSYQVSATDDLDEDPAVDCVPPSGSTFSIGTTDVECTATDDAGNVASGSFKVNVEGADEQIDDLVTAVENLDVKKGLKKGLLAKLGNAQRQIETGKEEAACGQLGAFAEQVEAHSGKKHGPGNQLTAEQAEDLIAAAERIKAVLGCRR